MALALEAGSARTPATLRSSPHQRQEQSCGNGVLGKVVQVIKLLSNGYLVVHARTEVLGSHILYHLPSAWFAPAVCWNITACFALLLDARAASCDHHVVLCRPLEWSASDMAQCHTILTSGCIGFADSTTCGCCVDIFVVHLVPQSGGLRARFRVCPMQQLRRR
jgi:hypothetical protein